MGKLFCILGMSGSGKDTVFKRLLSEGELSLKRVVTYTTRPRRAGETEGGEYHFIDRHELEKLKKNGRILEQRNYNTIQGIWTYCTVDDGQIDMTKGNYLLIVTPEAFLNLKMFFGAEAVVPLYVVVEDGLRLERLLKRERGGNSPDYEEMCRRFLADKKDFAGEKLLQCGIEKVYINDDIEFCVNQIKADILKKIG